MEDLKTHGLMVRHGTGSHVNEKRLELRIIKGNSFVAWFCHSERMSDGIKKVSTTTELVPRAELTDAQHSAAKEWLRNQVLAVY